MRKKIWSRLTACTLTAVMLCGQAVSAAPAAAAERANAQAGVFSTAEQLTQQAKSNGVDYDGFIFKLRDNVAIALDADEAEGIGTVEYTPAFIRRRM